RHAARTVETPGRRGGVGRACRTLHTADSWLAPARRPARRGNGRPRPGGPMRAGPEAAGLPPRAAAGGVSTLAAGDHSELPPRARKVPPGAAAGDRRESLPRSAPAARGPRERAEPALGRRA